MTHYSRPGTIEEAVTHLARTPSVVVAGCTDYYCQPHARPFADDVLDITGIAEARGVTLTEDGWRLGALTTWTEIARIASLPPEFRALREAARQVGGVQIQNAGTIGGNLCNASPAADGVPALLILDPLLELCSARGSRRLPLADFIIGNRQTVRRPDELLTAILVPLRHGVHASTFLKLGARAYQVISIVMVAALIEADDRGGIAAAAVAVGSCAPVAQRLPALEMALTGRPLAGPALSSLLHAAHFAPVSPISDVRGTADYRREAARTLVGRALDELQQRLLREPS